MSEHEPGETQNVQPEADWGEVLKELRLVELLILRLPDKLRLIAARNFSLCAVSTACINVFEALGVLEDTKVEVNKAWAYSSEMTQGEGDGTDCGEPEL